MTLLIYVYTVQNPMYIRERTKAKRIIMVKKIAMMQCMHVMFSC